MMYKGLAEAYGNLIFAKYLLTMMHCIESPRSVTICYSAQ